MLDSERPAVAADQDDGLQLRHDVGDLRQAGMQPRLGGANFVVGHAAHDLVDLGKGAVDGLEHFERLFLLHVERALDALVGGGMNVAIADPRRIAVERRRQHQRCDHHQFQQTDCRFPCRVH